MSRFFVTGIGTDVGKTIVSTVLVEALKCDYWKPIQAGGLDATDSMFVQQHISNSTSKIHQEKYQLNTPASPHFAAEIDGVDIQLTDFKIPETNNNLLVEGAGGLMVPFNRKHTILDLIMHFNLPTIVVTRNYLGSINHTILTINCLKQAGIKIAGLIYSGKKYEAGELVVEQLTSVQTIGRVAEMKVINKEQVAIAADSIREDLIKALEL